MDLKHQGWLEVSISFDSFQFVLFGDFIARHPAFFYMLVNDLQHFLRQPASDIRNGNNVAVVHRTQQKTCENVGVLCASALCSSHHDQIQLDLGNPSVTSIRKPSFQFLPMRSALVCEVEVL